MNGFRIFFKVSMETGEWIYKMVEPPLQKRSHLLSSDTQGTTSRPGQKSWVTCRWGGGWGGAGLWYIQDPDQAELCTQKQEDYHESWIWLEANAGRMKLTWYESLGWTWSVVQQQQRPALSEDRWRKGKSFFENHKWRLEILQLSFLKEWVQNCLNGNLHSH